MSLVFDYLARFLLHALEDSAAPPSSPAGEWIKIIHASKLKEWDRIKRYDEFDCERLSEYEPGRHRLQALGREIKELLDALKRIEELDADDLVVYNEMDVRVPRDILKRQYRFQLPPPTRDGTAIEAPEGAVEGGCLTVKRAWRDRSVRVRYRCPRREEHAAEIAELRGRIDAASPEQRAKLEEYRTSPFNHPVLFISHRWEDTAHPDPDGRQLAKLSKLENCFVIYDYASFPQVPQTRSEREALDRILRSMNTLIRNVVAIESPTYLERGWCLYEYIVASMNKTTVCDEVKDPALVELRDLVATRTPPARQIRGHSMESGLQNAKNQGIFDCINRLLPVFQNSRFTVPEDRELVRNLLIEQLQKALPKKMEYQEYVSEWTQKSWTRAELERAFADRLETGALHTNKLKPRHLEVPDTIEAAARSGYTVKNPRPFDPKMMDYEWMELLGDGEGFNAIVEGVAAGMRQVLRIALVVAFLAVLALAGLGYLLYRALA
jgi:hypothetical protein